MPEKTNAAKIRKKSWIQSVRSSRTPPNLPNVNLNYQKNNFCLKLVPQKLGAAGPAAFAKKKHFEK
jgi:hypothetical protein